MLRSETERERFKAANKWVLVGLSHAAGIRWFNLRDSSGVVHRALGPRIYACEPSRYGHQILGRPTATRSRLTCPRCK